MSITNLSRVLQQLRAYGDGVRAGAAQGLAEEAEQIKARSQELVPTGEGPNAGRLGDSARVTVEQHSDRVVATISYGGADTGVDYAVQVHEDLSARHDDGQAQFLTQAVNEAEAGMAERIGRAAVEVGKRRARL